jgi:uncharacterized protein (UPF0248 family)
MNPLRDLLNEARWGTGDLDELSIIVRHRGATHDERAVLGRDVTAIYGNGFNCPTDPAFDAPEEIIEIGGGEVFVPYHRVLRITKGDALVWEAR